MNITLIDVVLDAGNPMRVTALLDNCAARCLGNRYFLESLPDDLRSRYRPNAGSEVVFQPAAGDPFSPDGLIVLTIELVGYPIEATVYISSCFVHRLLLGLDVITKYSLILDYSQSVVVILEAPDAHVPFRLDIADPLLPLNAAVEATALLTFDVDLPP
jgi:hypothetical protein